MTNEEHLEEFRVSTWVHHQSHLAEHGVEVALGAHSLSELDHIHRVAHLEEKPAPVVLPLTPNAIDCMDCEEIYEPGVECPEEPADHAIQAAFVTNEPLGLENDKDYYHHGRKQYEYTGQGIVREIT